jgi:hypothetical protein
MAAAAADVLDRLAGATDRTLDLIVPLLAGRDRG